MQRRDVLGVGRAGGQVDQVLQARHGVARRRARRSGSAPRRAGRRRPRTCPSRSSRPRCRRPRARCRGPSGRRSCSRRRPRRSGSSPRRRRGTGPSCPRRPSSSASCAWVPGRGHDRLVVVHRQRVEDDVGRRRPRRPAGTTRCSRSSPGTRARPGPASRSSGAPSPSAPTARRAGRAPTSSTVQNPRNSRRDTPRRPEFADQPVVAIAHRLRPLRTALRRTSARGGSRRSTDERITRHGGSLP